MSKRVDTASRVIHASSSTIYQSFETAHAMESWLPPQGMAGTMLEFAFREGGAYRLRLTYTEAQHTVRFVKLLPHQRIEQAVTFKSDDPAFAGEMRITWTLEPGQGATLVTVRCEDVPAGIRPEDHQAGLTSTLNNLASFVEKQT